MDKPQLVMLSLVISCIIVSCGVCAYMLTKLKHLPDEVKEMVVEDLAQQQSIKEENAEAKLRWKQQTDYEKQKLRNMDEVLEQSNPYGYYEPPKKPASKVWVAEIILPKDDSKQPAYFFHCQAANQPEAILKGKAYLYSGRGFVTTDNPTTAILLQQLLNDGQLTVKPFNPDTNDLPKQ